MALVVPNAYAFELRTFSVKAPKKGCVGVPVSFAINATSDSPAFEFMLDFGDGSGYADPAQPTGIGQITTHTYINPGDYEWLGIAFSHPYQTRKGSITIEECDDSERVPVTIVPITPEYYTEAPAEVRVSAPRHATADSTLTVDWGDDTVTLLIVAAGTGVAVFTLYHVYPRDGIKVGQNTGASWATIAYLPTSNPAGAALVSHWC